MRKQLIDLVMKQGQSIYAASKFMKINNSTAKVIIRKYKQNGQILTKKSVK